MGGSDREDLQKDLRERSLDYGDVLQSIIIAGHSLNDILNADLPSLPYKGYSLPMVVLFGEKVDRAKNFLKADLLGVLQLAISGSIDEEANRTLKKEIDRLNNG